MPNTVKRPMVEHPRSPLCSSPWSTARPRGTSVPVASLVNRQLQTKIRENGLLYYQRWRNIYPYPCDDRAAERLDLLHSLIYETALDGALHAARLPQLINGQRLRVLDIGCGSARWAQEMANRNPQADIFGIDIGDVDERLAPGVGNNFFFRCAVDFEASGWDADYEPASFHFIHIAQLQGAVSSWPALLRRANRLLAPGGQLEVIEIDWSPQSSAGTLPPNSPYARWWNTVSYASSARGKPLALDACGFERHLSSSGLDLRMHRSYRLDLIEHSPRLQRQQLHRNDSLISAQSSPHTSPSEIQQAMQRKLAGWTRLLLGTKELYFFNDQAMALLTGLPGWTAEHVRDLSESARKEMNSRGCPIYFFLHTWTARKPT